MKCPVNILNNILHYSVISLGKIDYQIQYSKFLKIKKYEMSCVY